MYDTHFFVVVVVVVMSIKVYKQKLIIYTFVNYQKVCKNGKNQIHFHFLLSFIYFWISLKRDLFFFFFFLSIVLFIYWFWIVVFDLF